MYEKIGFYVVVSERPNPSTGILGKLPLFVSNRISSLFKNQIREVRATSVQPTSLTRARRIAAKEIAIGQATKITETTILSERWTMLNANERRRHKREFKKNGTVLVLEVKR